MPLKCCKKSLVFLVAKTLKDIINHSLTGLLKALYSGEWGGGKTRNFKTTPAKTPLNSPQKTKLGPKNVIFRVSDFLAESLKAYKN